MIELPAVTGLTEDTKYTVSVTVQQTSSTLDELPAPGFRGVNPPMVGWWLARRVEQIGAPFKSRRWWNGTGWSAPCPVGGDNESANEARAIPSLFRPDQIEWQGLAQPDLETPYPYLLEAQTDVEALDCSEIQLDAQRVALKMMYDAIVLEGYETPGDGGGGRYVLVEDTAEDNDGSVIVASRRAILD